MLELRHICKSFREGEVRRTVFDGLSLDIRSGEFTAITGRSGTGKSTLLNLISGIDLPDSGDILIDGVDLTSLSERERTLRRRHGVGFVFQFFNLIPTLSVEENLLLPLELIGARHDVSMQRVHRLLECIGLGDRAASFPDRLSGGEQQRVAIARALVHEPELVLADEPTGNLDAESARNVMALLAGLVGDTGQTLVMVTHSDEAAAHAGQVLRIADGRVVDARGDAPSAG